MQYRRFGKLDFQASVLGFGCMRLPSFDGSPQSERIDEAQVIRMVRYAIDHGVNYVDTAYPYHNGMSEVVLGRALKDGYRDRVKVVSKSPVWMIRKADDFDLFLDQQLTRLNMDHLDFYLLHALTRERWESVLSLGVLPRAEAALKDGRIGSLGFSFHDTTAVFKHIVDGYDGWTICQIQYNYMDTENQAGIAGLKYAASKGLAVVVMEPLLGGRLANPPTPVRELFESFPKKRSPAEWGLQWVWDQPEVSVVLSGMSAMAQVVANVRAASRSAVASFGVAEHDLIRRVRQVYLEKMPIPCTKCGYCLPCPNGVNIPRNFELYNDGCIHEDPGTSRLYYERFLREAERASACTQCRICEEKCPQGIPIAEWMPKVHAVLGEGKAYE